jgi:dedicated sortase system histidine kinase
VAYGELLDRRPDDARALLAQLELAFADERDDEVCDTLSRAAANVDDAGFAAALLGLRGRLLAITSVFLLVPWLGYEYIRELERFLRRAQNTSLTATAQAVATALHDRPQLFYGDRAQRLGSLRDMLDTVAAGDAATVPSSAAPPGPATPASPHPHGPATRVTEPTMEIQQILRGLERAPAQIWVIDRNQQVRARTGSLHQAPGGDVEPLNRPLVWLETTILSPLYRLILKQPRDDFVDDAPPAFGRELESALVGVLANGTRATRDGTAAVAFAAAPVWVGDRVEGVVVTEQTTNSVLRQRNLAFERLFGLLLLVVLTGAALLFVFASRLGRRIRALRDDARSAVDAEGRVVQRLSSSTAGDELGDLSREFAAVLRRLADYTQYREHLASRLSHELRTPIAMIRSSLDNLQLAQSAAEAGVYVERAHSGLQRLNFIFDAMAEATRLESAIANTPRERFNLAEVVSSCVEAYRSIYPITKFAATLPRAPLPILGNPDLVAQMLDKLIANAVEFSLPDTPIEVLLETHGRRALLWIANSGARLPDGMGSRLFDSMVSVRPTGGSAPHLGVGLYIVRLIVEFHEGEVEIANRAGANGVVVTAEFPLAQ